MKTLFYDKIIFLSKIVTNVNNISALSYERFFTKSSTSKVHSALKKMPAKRIEFTYWI